MMGWDGSIVRIEPWIIIGTTASSPMVVEDMGATESAVFSFTRGGGGGDVISSSPTTIVEKDDDDDFEQVVPMVGL